MYTNTGEELLKNGAEWQNGVGMGEVDDVCQNLLNLHNITVAIYDAPFLFPPPPPPPPTPFILNAPQMAGVTSINGHKYKFRRTNMKRLKQLF